MDGLPELVKAALNQACGSGRSLSWKLQESEKGTLLQLVWKAKVEQPSVLEGSDGVGSNWKCSGRRRISPSRARRNVRRRKAFLEKRAAVVSQKGLGCGEKGKERGDGVVKDVDSGVVASRGSELSDGGSEVSDVEELDVVEEVDLAGCFDVSYEKRNGEHGLRYRSDDVSEGWTPVRRRRRGRCGVENGGRGLVIGEGARVSYLEFSGAPGLSVQQEGGARCWNPISSRTRSRFK